MPETAARAGHNDGRVDAEHAEGAEERGFVFLLFRIELARGEYRFANRLRQDYFGEM